METKFFFYDGILIQNFLLLVIFQSIFELNLVILKKKSSELKKFGVGKVRSSEFFLSFYFSESGVRSSEPPLNDTHIVWYWK